MQIKPGVVKSQKLEESLKGWVFKVSLGYKTLSQKKFKMYVKKLRTKE